MRLWDGSSAWAVTRYEDVRAVLGDRRISADGLNPALPALTPARRMTPDEVVFPRMDDPRHGEHRRMLARDFTVKQAEAMRPGIQEIVDDTLDEMIGKGRPADLIADFALPVPSTVIALLLGVPPEDRAFFHGKSQTILDLTAPPEQVRDANVELFGYMLELVDRKEREPGDDLITQLVTERVATGELTRRQVGYIGRVLLTAGHETTSNMIGLGALTLLQHPDQLTKVRDAEDPRVLVTAVEELLRYHTIAENAVVRVAIEDATVGGHLVRAGEGLLLCLPVANRDSSFLSDEPDSFNVDNRSRGHVAFGYGPHQCLGQNLARVELQIALGTLLRRLPDLRLAVPFDEIPFNLQMVTFGAARLPVAW
ncbi:cytochrome P450 [Streptomyces chartreusis]|uniref:cytochrome P450 n=1 Tax=Streptomyces chartreusis TaxID=1969 RepID=UPI0036C11FDD